MSVGNDVVDLGDPETWLSGLHPRFDERVFGPAERAALEASPERQRLHWALWAAKESAYKARKRLEPGAVFSPREFKVELSARPAPGAAGVAVGRVTHHGERFDLEVHFGTASVHAVARSEGEAGAPLLWRVETAHGDPGVAARGLAAAAIGSALGLDPVQLRIADRPPVLLHLGRLLDATVSLSHHGRFVAFACSLPAVVGLPPGSSRRTRSGGEPGA